MHLVQTQFSFSLQRARKDIKSHVYVNRFFFLNYYTLDGVVLLAFWFQASPPSNRLFFKATGSGGLGISIAACLAALASFEEICEHKGGCHKFWGLTGFV